MSNVKRVIYSGSDPGPWDDLVSSDVRRKQGVKTKGRSMFAAHGKLTKACLNVVSAVGTCAVMLLASSQVQATGNRAAGEHLDSTSNAAPDGDHDEPFDFDAVAAAAWEGALELMRADGEDLDEAMREATEGLVMWTGVKPSHTPPWETDDANEQIEQTGEAV
ncbi:MAG: hypothetical protein KC619_24100 [Myxococcales bacterium]|nr:hypothetical protein [Myxococcales bacterium]